MLQTSKEQPEATIEKIVREEWGQVLATLVVYVRDFSLAEDMLQDACISALEHWPKDGVPRSPRAWLLQTARRKAIDRFRRQANFESKRAELEILTNLEQQIRPVEEDTVAETIPDHRLRLIFTCCHPALEEHARVALTLRTLGGLTTPEIARAFMIPEITMAQRLVRAKRKIKVANIPYIVPSPHLWPERIESVLTVIYLIFNEGYAARAGNQPTRADLCQEAIHLGNILVSLVPQEPEVAGLLALMLLHDSRRPARTNRDRNMVTLEHQDRALWQQDQIDKGVDLLQQALMMSRPGHFQIQAAISAVHAQAKNYEETDWHEITLLYGKLYELQPSPVIALNAAVALSFAQGAQAGLTAMAELDAHGELAQYQPYHAARADLFRRAGRMEDSVAAYRQALEFTENAAERNFLEQRLVEILE